MASRVRRFTPTLLAAACVAWPLAARADAASDWITVNKDYSSQRYVDLDQITPANVARLNEVCEIELNEPSWFTSGLLMVGRTIYASTPRATYAFDAATCEPRWRTFIEPQKRSPPNSWSRLPERHAVPWRSRRSPRRVGRCNRQSGVERAERRSGPARAPRRGPNRLERPGVHGHRRQRWRHSRPYDGLRRQDWKGTLALPRHPKR